METETESRSHQLSERHQLLGGGHYFCCNVSLFSDNQEEYFVDIFELFGRPALIQLFDQVDFSFYFMMIWAFRMDFRKTNFIN
jgi:hypothetical protein